MHVHLIFLLKCSPLKQFEGRGKKQVFEGVGKKSSCMLRASANRVTMSHAAHSQTAKLQGAVAGNWFAWAGVCTAANGWSIPADSMYVEDVVGEYLIKLTDCPGRDCNKLKVQRFCNHCQRPEQSQQCMCDKAPQNIFDPVKCEVCGQIMQPIRSEAPVNALLHTNGEARFCGPLKFLVNDQGNVLVKFGYGKQFEQAEEKPCYDRIEEVHTPETPSTQRTPSPSPQAKRRRMCGILFEPTEDLNS